MKRISILIFALVFCFSQPLFAQVSVKTLVDISKAEDELRFDAVLENLLKSKIPKVRARAALAAGRIGNDAAIPALESLLENDKDAEVRAFAAFAIGEIESINGADAILNALNLASLPENVRARAVEAAGKIAAANAKDPKAKELGTAILDALEAEDARRTKQSKDVILLGITAALRAKADESEFVLAKFLTNLDARVRADSANALARLRAKNANEKFRAMLLTDSDPVARANAARGLGAAEDKDSLDILTESSLTDDDSRVRVSAIRSLASLKDAKSAEKLIVRGEKLLADYKNSKFKNPSEKNELLEIISALGRILANSKDEKADKLLDAFRNADDFSSAETEIALARIMTNEYIEPLSNISENAVKYDWRTSSAAFQALAEIASSEGNGDEKIRSVVELLQIIKLWIESDSKERFAKNTNLAIPDLLRAYAAFKSETTSDIFRSMIAGESDVFIRAALAEILGDQTASKENVEALKKAFSFALVADKTYNDAQLAILDALFKQDKKEAVGVLLVALDAPDYLVRKKAFDLLKDRDLEKDFPGIKTAVANALAKKKDQVLPYSPAFGTKLGQILNTNADYLRAVSRKNGTVKAVLTTEKGKFTIDLFPENAPLTVDNFIKLAKSGYFNGVEVHRVVPNFVMQDGDPRGDGNGGPGWSIRCEINMLSYERGAVGMALSGKDTGGSQWFVTHSPQPHLDGGYTVFGKVNETDMKIVDMIVRGDKILSVKIDESYKSRKTVK